MVVVDDVGGGALTTKSSDKQTRRDAYRHAWTKCVTSRNASAPASLSALQTLSYLCLHLLLLSPRKELNRMTAASVSFSLPF